MAGHRGRQPGVRGGRRYLHKVKVTHEHERRLQHLAVAHGVTVSRLLVESALTQGSASPAAWRALYADLAATKRQVTGACTNLNQLALQANAERQLPERTGELLARLWDAADALDAAVGRLDPVVAVKIRRGGDFRGVMEYLAADKEGVQREDPHVVAGLGREGERLDTETVRSVAVELDAPRQAFGVGVTHQGKPGHVWHTALSFDRPLGDDEMRRVTEEFMRRMDFGPVRWVAVRHGVNSAGCDHVHIVASMVRDDGKRARDFDDQKRASKAAGVIERKYGLGVCEGRELGIVDRGYHGAEKAIAERLHGKGTEPAPDYIRRVLRAAVVEAPGRENFTRYLAEHDVTAHPGRMGGFSYSVPGSRQYQGSKLAPDLSWPRIQARWASPVPQTADQAAHRAAGRLAAASLRTERRPGPLARESRELGRFAQTRAGVSLVLPTAVAQLLRERIRAAERAAAQADEYVRGLDRGPRRAQARDRGAELDL